MLRSALAAALVAVVAASFAVPAYAQAPPNLTGESLTANPEDVDVTCEGSAEAYTIRWDVTGVATGPYPGTFTETGTQTGPGVDVVDVSFRIESPAGTVTGTKHLFPNAPSAVLPCGNPAGVGRFGLLRYEATIDTPEGQFTDQGFADTTVSTTSPGSGFGVFREDFVSSPQEPEPGGPTSKDECEKEGWRSFGIFKNQGDCVAFVESGGGNEPGQNVPGP